MQIIFITLCVIAGIGALITVRCLLQDNDWSLLLPVYRPRKKKVGATYWGHYEDESEIDTPEETVILPKICSDDDHALAGGTTYVKGRPVKSARVR